MRGGLDSCTFISTSAFSAEAPAPNISIPTFVAFVKGKAAPRPDAGRAAQAET